MITLIELKELLVYCMVTGIFTWKVSRNQFVKAAQVAGHLNKGYIRIQVKGKLYYAHRLAWFYEHGKWPTKDLDHIDQDKSNNRISNLREVTEAQNSQNQGKRRNNTSGFKGVYPFKRDKKWMAQISLQGKRIHLGVFPTPELASEAYLSAQAIHHSHRPQPCP